MMNNERKKTIVGFLFAVLLSVCFVVLNGRSAREQSRSGFTLYAYFSKLDGVVNGAEVRLAGLPVGRVVDLSFAKDYRIKVEMVLNKDYELPADSSLQIETDGLMGQKHLEIMPGADDDVLRENDVFGYTQDVMMLNDLLDKVISYMRDKKGVDNEEKSD